jgi:hypothetical protein
VSDAHLSCLDIPSACAASFRATPSASCIVTPHGVSVIGLANAPVSFDKRLVFLRVTRDPGNPLRGTGEEDPAMLPWTPVRQSGWMGSSHLHASRRAKIPPTPSPPPSTAARHTSSHFLRRFEPGADGGARQRSANGRDMRPLSRPICFAGVVWRTGSSSDEPRLRADARPVTSGPGSATLARQISFNALTPSASALPLSSPLAALLLFPLLPSASRAQPPWPPSPSLELSPSLNLFRPPRTLSWSPGCHHTSGSPPGSRCAERIYSDLATSWTNPVDSAPVTPRLP